MRFFTGLLLKKYLQTETRYCNSENVIANWNISLALWPNPVYLCPQMENNRTV